METRVEIVAKVERDREGTLRVSTVVALGDRRELRIETSKFNGIIKCRASVVTVTDHGYTCRISFAGDRSGDYYKELARSGVRATEKNLRAVHAAGLAHFDGVMAEVRDWYGIKEAA